MSLLLKGLYARPGQPATATKKGVSVAAAT
jgi:hypothetical protein